MATIRSFQSRAISYEKALEQLGGMSNVLDTLSHGYLYFGFNRGVWEGVEGVWYREWAPAAKSLSLIGDFNDWDRNTHPLDQDEHGVWSIFMPLEIAPKPGQRAKVHVVGADGSRLDRIPAYARRVTQDWQNGDFVAEVILDTAFDWTHPRPPKGPLKIYEAHIGMATEEYKIATFAGFQAMVLPHVKSLGYNAIQLMGILEHPYYGSFGYHVSSFYAVSSRFGTPQDFKTLVDACHAEGIAVIVDLVHSHAVKNVHEGLNNFDGSHDQYFHFGPKGDHEAWDSKVFDYGKHEVLGFLLSNVRFWLDEFNIDGFRFDGVTSMMYFHHGLGRNSWSMADYFGAGVDEDAVTYLQLANELSHVIYPECVTIAEDVSGMPRVTLPVEEGGLGFDFTLAMGPPDFWETTLKTRRDEEWHLGDFWHALTERRPEEHYVGYVESHDQALVGGQTIAYQLMGAAMLDQMAKSMSSPVIERGIALHKIIRILTFSLADKAWMSFMGNEFGHPEWIDFPRAENGWDFTFARRQWSLAKNPFLHYQGLLAFDQALMQLDQEFGVLGSSNPNLLSIDEARKVMVYERHGLVFAVNLHSTESYPHLRISVPSDGTYKVVLDSDRAEFSGFGRLREHESFPVNNLGIEIYLPNRTALVLSAL